MEMREGYRSQRIGDMLPLRWQQRTAEQRQASRVMLSKGLSG
jgi:hypothetical protein